MNDKQIILNIYWPQRISLEELIRRENENVIGDIIKFGWEGHTLRRHSNISRQALDWDP
jgi:hypothetical protein